MNIILSYAILSAWSFLAATIIPLGAEPCFLEVVHAYPNYIWLTIGVGTFFNTLGSITTFYLGQKGAESIEKRLSAQNEKRYLKAQTLIKKWGTWAMFLAFVPFLGDVLVAVGGAMQLPFKQSVMWILAGKIAKHISLAFGLVAIAKAFF